MEACRYIINELKASVPIWKKEVYDDGEVWKENRMPLLEQLKKSAVDDQQWLTYWVLYSFITLFELIFAPVLKWLPFWSYAKPFLNCWLVLPWFNGGAHVYEHFVRPMIVNQQLCVLLVYSNEG
ncbi:unnamed protein product [Miscanthus lutarioriparius]|uniref:HVA22-like protein n=1 Tax=Miscanthus lutarioriparius TaxID=422564 RepID=A0A811PIY8_9POAL|nr:unnamed protein product [Miscanthus lutarioriparius]